MTLLASRVTPPVSQTIEITTILSEAALQLVTKITKLVLRRMVHRPSPEVVHPEETQQEERLLMTTLALASAATTLHALWVTEAVPTAPDRVAVVAIEEVVVATAVAVGAAGVAVKAMMTVALVASGQTTPVESEHLSLIHI